MSITRIFRRSTATSSLLTLPNELLFEIASLVPPRINELVVEQFSLASLSRCNRKLRAICLPSLFEDVPITSIEKLLALANVSQDLLQLIRNLNIFLTKDLLESFKQASYASPNTHTTAPNPFSSLASILSSTPDLVSLSLQMAENTGSRSGWALFPMTGANGISFGPAFTKVLQARGPLKLPKLQTLHMDGFEDISSVLHLAPALSKLSLRLSGGFSISSSNEFIRSCECVPHLRHLEFSPSSLRLSSENPIELLESLGKKLPELETLDLQTRSFSYGVYFCSTFEPIASSDIHQSLSYLPSLVQLRLPANLFTSEELESFQLNHPDITTRKHALEGIESRERDALLSISLRTLAFTRYHNGKDNSMEYSISYSIRPTLRKKGRSYEVEEMNVHLAREGMEDAWPLAPTDSLTQRVRDTWKRKEGDKVVGLMAAGVVGFAVRELGQRLISS